MYPAGFQWPILDMPKVTIFTSCLEPKHMYLVNYKKEHLLLWLRFLGLSRPRFCLRFRLGLRLYLRLRLRYR